MIYAHTAYGLTLHLCFPCPLLLPADPAAVPDMVMREGNVPRDLDNPVVAERAWQAEEGRFLVKGGRRAGRFLVEGGGQVTLERNAEAQNERLAQVFVHTVLVAVLRQRGLLALHASAAQTECGAVAISGVSGAGKSTTLSALIAHGATMLSDDVTVLQIGSQGCIEVLPGAPQLHLCQDAADRLQTGEARQVTGQQVMGVTMHSRGRAKLAVRPTLVPSTHAVPLRAIYLLSADGENAKGENTLSVRRLLGVERFAALQECVYTPLMPHEHPNRFDIFAAIAERVTLFRVQRPPAVLTVDEIVENILRGDNVLPYNVLPLK